MLADVAVVGGTGIGERLAALGGLPVAVPTAHGVLRGRRVELDFCALLMVQRHAAGHKTPPHRVNYRALAAGLRAAGVRACLATAACGGLRTDWPPGTPVVCSGMIDLTCRRLTMWDREVRHVDFGGAFETRLREALLAGCATAGLAAQPEGVYAGLDGPRYETPAEIEMIRRLGGDLVGMTASSEAICLREAGVPYACLAVVTNYAAGLTSASLDHGEVADVMGSVGDAVVNALLAAARLLAV
jgi:5'-methylthioadenosine phosphorylase